MWEGITCLVFYVCSQCTLFCIFSLTVALYCSRAPASGYLGSVDQVHVRAFKYKSFSKAVNLLEG